MTKATNKTTIAAVVVDTNKEVVTTEAVVETKASKARAVFAKAYPDGKTTTMQRKDIIGAMVAEAGLTKAGAATYLQNMKNKAGITVHRTPVTA